MPDSVLLYNELLCPHALVLIYYAFITVFNRISTLTGVRIFLELLIWTGIWCHINNFIGLNLKAMFLSYMCHIYVSFSEFSSYSYIRNFVIKITAVLRYKTDHLLLLSLVLNYVLPGGVCLSPQEQELF